MTEEEPKSKGSLRKSVLTVLAACAAAATIGYFSFSAFSSGAEDKDREESIANPSDFGMESPEPFVHSDEAFAEDLLLHRRQALYLLREYRGEHEQISQISMGLESDWTREEMELVQLLMEWGHAVEVEFDATADLAQEGFLDPGSLAEYSDANASLQDSLFIELMLENQRATLKLATGEAETGVSSEIPQLAKNVSNQATPLIIALEDI